MATTMVRLGFTLLLSIFMIAGTEPASAAGTLVKITFGGTGFSGWFEYDQSLRDSTPGVFNFQGSPLTHKICYTTSSAGCVPFSGIQCEPYTITTSGGSGKTFELKITAPKSPSTQVVIVLPMGITLSQTNLPACTSYPITPKSGSTFTLSGGSSFTGTITTLQCSVVAAAAPAPSVQSAPVAQAANFVDDPNPAPAPPYPVYAYQPRPACCLSSRLFCRGSLRLGCR
jgi:hypothetical protein